MKRHLQRISFGANKAIRFAKKVKLTARYIKSETTKHIENDICTKYSAIFAVTKLKITHVSSTAITLMEASKKFSLGLTIFCFVSGYISSIGLITVYLCYSTLCRTLRLFFNLKAQTSKTSGDISVAYAPTHVFSAEKMSVF